MTTLLKSHGSLNKIVSIFFVFSLVFSYVPVGVFAEEVAGQPAEETPAQVETPAPQVITEDNSGETGGQNPANLETKNPSAPETEQTLEESSGSLDENKNPTEPQTLLSAPALTSEENVGDNNTNASDNNTGSENNAPRLMLTSSLNCGDDPIINCCGSFNHTCALPNTLGDSTVEPVTPGWDSLSLQDVFNNLLIDRSVIGDQKQYQSWDTSSATTSIRVEFLNKISALNHVFGYYRNGDISTFVPVFSMGAVDGYSSVPEFSTGQSVDLDITGAGNIGFAIKTSDGNTYATNNSLNENGNDHAVAYDWRDNVYIISFEDLPIASSDTDYNDVTVRISVLGCQNKPEEPNPPYIDLSCKIVSPDQTGWYGTYYNFSSTTPGMELPSSEWSTSYGDPLSSNSTSSDWYTSKFARFSRVDSSLEFGDNFFPFDTHPEELNATYNHDYHFGAHWSAKVTASTTGSYDTTYSSDDDAWVYVNGKLAIDNSGIHAASVLNKTVDLNAGENMVDIYFAERHTTASNLSFKFNDQSLIIKPYSKDCATNTPPTITLIGDNPFNIIVGNTFTDPGATATDTEDGDLTSKIISTSTVDTAVVGTYKVDYSVTDSGGLSASTTRTVIVTAAPSPENPSVTLSANPQTIVKGNSSTLSWNSQNTTSCSAAWTSATSTSGTATVSPDSTTDYSITCTGSKGSVSATTTITVTLPPPVNPPSSGGGGGSLSGSHRHSTGEVLGVTTCSYLIDYLKIDWQNNPIEVLKLQSFLNIFEGENLSLNGNFDQATFEAVERFQNKYKSDILTPWGHNAPTGFVYILTKKKVNEIYCSTVYPLTQAQQDEINNFRNLLSSYQTSGYSEGNIGQQHGYIGNDLVTITNTGESSNTAASVPVVELSSSSSSTSESVIRNAAISLFAFPKKIVTEGKYLVIFLILLAILIALIRLFAGSGSNGSAKKSAAKIKPIVPIVPVAKKSEKKEEKTEAKESPIIILPGITDEEIVVENPEEEEILLNTPEEEGKIS